MVIKESFKDIALRRIKRLFELAQLEAARGREDRSYRYVQLARKIGMRYRVRIPWYLKMRLCKSCKSYLIPGRNMRVRLKGDYITTTCLKCGRQMRRPYKPKRVTHHSSVARE